MGLPSTPLSSAGRHFVPAAGFVPICAHLTSSPISLSLLLAFGLFYLWIHDTSVLILTSKHASQVAQAPTEKDSRLM